MRPSFGARSTKDGVSFRLWAPAARRVDLLLDRRHAMRRRDDGWYVAEVHGLTAGSRYKFRIDDEIDVPDPASAFQPEDVFGPSEVIDHASFAWRADAWRGRPWEETVLIETHVGTFTPRGTYRAMIDKLDHLAGTGVTALELMPLADFAGRRGWGYDGVLWYAPDSAYGRPEDLKTLIDEAHLRGLMVFLDVVYNHFGPEGNYLSRYAPTFFTDAHTPWGSTIDYRVPQVRAFAVENALAWLSDYRFDGLRLDAANHIMALPGESSMLHDLSVATGELAKATGRHIHLVLENGDNRASLLDAAQEPPNGKYRAQWNDDYHHVWHVMLTGSSPATTPTIRRRASILRARWPRASSIRARSPNSGATSRAASRAARCRWRPSSISSRTMTRSATARSATGSRAWHRRKGRGRARRHASRSHDTNAVHGRGMGLDGALPVLLRFPGRACRCRAQGTSAGICLGLRKIWRRGPRPARPSNAAIGRARLDVAHARAAGTTGSGAGAARASPQGDRTTAEGRGLRQRRDHRQWSFDRTLAHGDGAMLRLTANLSDHEITHSSESAGTPIWGSAAGDRLPPWAVHWRLGG